MELLLHKAIELPLSQYSSLTSPIFMGQTSMTDAGTYWVVMKSGDTLYKIHMFC